MEQSKKQHQIIDNAETTAKMSEAEPTTAQLAQHLHNAILEHEKFLKPQPQPPKTADGNDITAP